MNRICNYITQAALSTGHWALNHHSSTQKLVNHLGVATIGLAAAGAYLGDLSIPQAISHLTVKILKYGATAACLPAAITLISQSKVESLYPLALPLVDHALSVGITYFVSQACTLDSEPIYDVIFLTMLAILKLGMFKNIKNMQYCQQRIAAQPSIFRPGSLPDWGPPLLHLMGPIAPGAA